MNSTKKAPKAAKNAKTMKLKIVRMDRVNGQKVQPKGHGWVHVEEKTLRGKTFDLWKREEVKPLTKKEEDAILADKTMKSLSIGDSLVHYKSWHPPLPLASLAVAKSKKRSLKKPTLTRSQQIIQSRRRNAAAAAAPPQGLEAVVEKDDVDELVDMFAMGTLKGGASRKATRKLSKRRKPRRPVPWWHF